MALLFDDVVPRRVMNVQNLNSVARDPVKKV